MSLFFFIMNTFCYFFMFNKTLNLEKKPIWLSIKTARQQHAVLHYSSLHYVNIRLFWISEMKLPMLLVLHTCFSYMREKSFFFLHLYIFKIRFREIIPSLSQRVLYLFFFIAAHVFCFFHNSWPALYNK